MYASYKIHSQRRPSSSLFTLHTFAYALIGALLLLLALMLSATAAQAQGFTAGGVILGPPRVETVDNPQVTFWWAEASGSVATNCWGRQDFDFAYGPHPLDPVTSGIVYEVLDNPDAERRRADAMAAHLANALVEGSPVTFDVEYAPDPNSGGCVIVDMVPSP